MELVKPQPQEFDLESVRAQLGDDWPNLDRQIFECLSSDVALVNSIARYIVNSGGKRLRPLLVLLAARACGRFSGRDESTARAAELASSVAQG